MTTRASTVLREVALTIGAGLGLLCLLLAVVAPLFGIRLLVFESGSMAPTVDTGGIAITRIVAADELAVGDIVSVTPAADKRVTHRIVGIEESNGQTLLTLQGDANETADPEPYPVTEADRVLVHVNHLGFAVDALASPYAVFLAGAFVAGLLLVGFRRRVPVVAATVAIVAVVGVGTLMPTRVAPTMAAFTDAATVPTGSLSTTTVPAPVVTCGTLSIGTTRLLWTSVPGATGYTLHYGASGSTTEEVAPSVTTKNFSGLAASGVFSVEAKVNYGSVTWKSGVSNKKSYTVLLFLVGVCADA